MMNRKFKTIMVVSIIFLSTSPLFQACSGKGFESIVHEPSSAMSTTGSPSTSESVGPRGQNANLFNMTFSDEFQNGFDTQKWNDHMFDQDPNPTINYAVENGSLKIWPQPESNGQFLDRSLDTDGKFEQTYGYFEIEAKLPMGKGTWPAFWLYNHDQPDPSRPQIYVLEAFGSDSANGWSDASFHPTAISPSVWAEDTGNEVGSQLVKNLGDLSSSFHVYGMKWEQDKQTFYFDGQEIYTVNSQISRPMYLVVDLLFGGAEDTPNSTETPVGKTNSYEVKYVRVWQFK